MELTPEQGHYLRDVLRLKEGAEVELFDADGATARGVLVEMSGRRVVVQVDPPHQAIPGQTLRWTIASAVPKANRADWMIEKLCELGAEVYIPLSAGRSIVVPEGHHKIERWRRLAAEAARQSRRRGVMLIDSIRTPSELLSRQERAVIWYLSTEPDATSILHAVEQLQTGRELLLLVGPEGGWTAEEIDLFAGNNLTGVRLTETILRIETAAVAAAAVVACQGVPGR